MFSSNGSVHDSNIIESFAGIMVYSQSVLGVFMLPTHVAYDEVCFQKGIPAFAYYRQVKTKIGVILL